MFTFTPYNNINNHKKMKEKKENPFYYPPLLTFVSNIKLGCVALVTALGVCISGCDEYDDTELWNTVHDHEQRLAALEAWQAEVNNNISALQTLLNTNDVHGAKKMLLQLYCSSQKQIKLEEIKELNEFMDTVGEDVDVIWGASYDDTLDDNVKITMVVTGFNVSDIPGMPDDLATAHVPFQVNGEPVVTEKDAHDGKIEQMMEGFYAGPKKPEEPEEPAEAPEEQEEELPEFSLDDLDDESKREDIENIPAWKRRMRKP